ncbi:hypothetical protein CHH28_13130 [Bacterioplanes sanyensis]|uniref:SGNH hydrolase-type esterase domain-containing protein n=1 Tax=Bacterioplanes sanyensis TaxID=1249553 RepID=A0A222FMF3_9GAMM|nr:SGNH/GDSL hydrolase family protein [Bacterioplanes sanyensis]ASP39561.1 hypothetical protein CHH28_13130 [Bacterioplanes sanyensis]
MNSLTSLAAYALLSPLLPWAIWQGKRVRRDTPRLPAAGGDCDGISGDGPATLELLHLGESTVAGVGIDHIEQGLTAQLAQRLADNHRVHWQTQSANGLTAGELLEHMPAQPRRCDVLVVTLGVNDTTGFTRRQHWRRQLCALVERIDAKMVIVTQVPPIHRFPALPAPLSWLLGVRARQLDGELMQLSKEKGWLYQAFELALEPQWMATDGYHPNAQGYQLWAHSLAETIMTSSAWQQITATKVGATNDLEAGAAP